MSNASAQGGGLRQCRVGVLEVAGDVVEWVITLRSVLAGPFLWLGLTAPSFGVDLRMV